MMWTNKVRPRDAAMKFHFQVGGHGRGASTLRLCYAE